MKIVLIFRKSRPGIYSIETVFHSIASELGTQAEVVEYEAGPRWQVLIDAWKLRKMRADVYHVTGDIHYITLLLPFKKTVLTVHDLGNYLYGVRGLKRLLYKWLWLLLPMRAAEVVTTGSSETLRCFREKLWAGAKAAVIPDCYNQVYRRSYKQFNEEKPLVLQVGTQPNKNLNRVVEAVRNMRCRLLIVGPLSGDAVEMLNVSAIEYEQHENLTQEEIYACYARADVLCFVSTHEGFGMPIVEANAVGLPVVTSNIPPMLEVAGGAACLVDPFDAGSIREGIQRIIRDPEFREGKISAGLRNAELYAPRAVALRFLDVYRDVANRSRTTARI